MTAERIFNIQNIQDFQDCTFQIFKYQFENNAVYRSFCDLLNIHCSDVSTIEEIPFLPIEFFKTKKILSSSKDIEIVFTSSGTTGMTTSKHYVSDLSIYQKSYVKGFEHFYGNISDYTVLALLPSYLEREGSSLIYMAEDFIQKSDHPASGFYLNQYEKLAETIQKLEKTGKKTLLLGVSFALLDLIEIHSFHLKNTLVMETGGMKGRRKELIRSELHQELKKGFGVSAIHSEYGMTELLSQAYSKGNGVFECPKWMKVLIRDPEDAFQIQTHGQSGGINIIDLANLHSCSFIATQDLGKLYQNETFEVLGRFDSSDIRGCNLLVF